MAVTHDDLAPSRKGADIGSKTGVVLIVFSILLGLICFVLCLIAEATHSQIIREASDGGGGETERNQCRYSGNGKTPLIYAAGAICFSVAEVLLLIGLSVESGHLKGWSIPRPTCFIAREGLFSSAGVLGITTVFLSSGLSITALRAQWLLQDQENVRREVMEASILYSSPPRPSGDRIMAVGGETPIVRHDVYYEPGLTEYLRAFDKII
ncbi:Protein of unknown function DUF1218 [Cynara cardunculus var. scolymus]|uniref:Uncharacterized protein n=1 Tax=Cynara cardunculus var. scolymus TaxID=59895 RepID=A0A103XTB1_CYNCS|nr:Protein of unknown function DUF1218 [Cynara cardunculus var. scolymus]